MLVLNAPTTLSRRPAETETRILHAILNEKESSKAFLLLSISTNEAHCKNSTNQVLGFWDPSPENLFNLMALDIPKYLGKGCLFVVKLSVLRCWFAEIRRLGMEWSELTHIVELTETLPIVALTQGTLPVTALEGIKFKCSVAEDTFGVTSVGDESVGAVVGVEYVDEVDVGVEAGDGVVWNREDGCSNVDGWCEVGDGITGTDNVTGVESDGVSTVDNGPWVDGVVDVYEGDNVTGGVKENGDVDAEDNVT